MTSPTTPARKTGTVYLSPRRLVLVGTKRELLTYLQTCQQLWGPTTTVQAALHEMRAQAVLAATLQL
jgi:hypothetical protein